MSGKEPRFSERQKARMQALEDACAPFITEFTDVLDLGIGRDQLVPRALERYGGACSFCGVDIYEPYVDAARKSGLYLDSIAIDVFDLPRYWMECTDIIVLGELIEHLDEADGQELLEYVAEVARTEKLAVVVTTPIGFMRQGSIDGNPYQTHKSGWMPDHFPEPWECVCFNEEHNFFVMVLNGERLV